MKIFISHSSREKWAARKISEELEELGCTTFLDEKDIETGEPIDDSIHKHLQTCDHFLLLMSPSSLKSDWVLVELGGALALKKHVVPVLLYVSPNEIPDPIRKYLARDINELDKYYTEVRKILQGRPQAPSPAPRPAKAKSVKAFKVGDRVRLPDAPVEDSINGVGWNSAGRMDPFCGKEATIIGIYKDFAAYVDVDNGRWVWAFRWLTSLDAH